jgi:hypothetical protein
MWKYHRRSSALRHAPGEEVVPQLADDAGRQQVVGRRGRAIFADVRHIAGGEIIAAHPEIVRPGHAGAPPGKVVLIIVAAYQLPSKVTRPSAS